MRQSCHGQSGSSQDKFLRGLERLTEGRHRPGFAATRSPFVRLQDVLRRMGVDRVRGHPTTCEAPRCGGSLSEGYHRRADGLALCRVCFEVLQETESKACDPTENAGTRETHACREPQLQRGVRGG
jgi:hypothetical protein